MVGKVVAVPKVKEPTSDDVPWGGGYVPPILINPWCEIYNCLIGWISCVFLVLAILGSNLELFNSTINVKVSCLAQR